MLIVCFIAFAALLSAWLVLPHSSETVKETSTSSLVVEMSPRESVSV